MMDSASRQRLQENWDTVADEVRDAAIASGRHADAVSIIGVTKYVDSQVTRALVEAGCHELGENRPQVLWNKNETLHLSDAVRWHLIGHLQRNKVRRTLRSRPLIHSIDSARLLAAVAEESVAAGCTTDVMLEINVSNEEAKTGMSGDEIRRIADEPIPAGLNWIGIMAMAGWHTDATSAQKQFAAARKFRDELQSTTGRSLPHLSMGMSGDFVEAIAEGSTMVRIGSRLYGGVVNVK